MGWTVYGREYESTELNASSVAIFQPIKPTYNIILRAVRVWLININNATFTSLHCRIYSDEIISSLHNPKVLLYTSDSRTKAEIFTENYGIRETYFQFADIPLHGGIFYNFVLGASGYAPILNTSFLCWKRGWPDPAYRTGFTPSAINLLQSPHDITLFAARL